MKTLILMGSPKKNGITSKLVNEVIPLLNDYTLLYASDLKINHCNGCETCLNLNRCVINDDMNLIYQKIKEAQRILILSPIYFFGFPGPLKNLIDRTQVFWHHPLYLTKKGLSCYIGEASNINFESCYHKSTSYILKNWGCKDISFKLFGNIKTADDLIKKGADFLRHWIES